ncbi:MAG: ferredoxin [Bacilli bacterium]|nr:ferredoxin [Bacilli bacterium]
MKLTVNKEACVGCGACTGVAEDLFEVTDEQVSVCKVEEIPEDKMQQAQDALDVCPTGAIVEVEEK